MFTYQERVALANETNDRLVGSIKQQLAEYDLADCAAPRNARTSNSFVIRLSNDNSKATNLSMLIIRSAVSELNKTVKIDGFRFRVIRRGRKPVSGSKYTYGGSLKLAQAKEIDVYVSYESTL